MHNILLVYKKSTLELMREGGKAEEAYLDNFPKRKAELERADVANKDVISFVEKYLSENNTAYHKCYRAKICDITLKDVTLIISIGGDGTLLDIAKYVSTIPILGVNSDPVKSTGFFCHTQKDNFISAFQNLDSFPKSVLPRMKLTINSKPYEFPVLNDVFVTSKNHADMIRMQGNVDNGDDELFFRSSGLLISTANGSTAWMYNEGGEIMPTADKRLQFRESGARNKKAGFVSTNIELVSHMYAGVLAIDGSHQIETFTFGAKIVLEPGAAPLTIYGDIEAKKEKLRNL
jgi:NAD+ kinase